MTDVSGLIPLMRSSALGRAYLDLEIVVALLGAAAVIALRLDRPDRKPRSVAELLALTGAILCAAAALAVPGLAGHAAQTSPVGASLAFDWVHMAAASLWIGGLAGLSILAWRTPADDRMAVLGRVVPRFSRIALASVLLIIASGVGGTIIHMPTLASLWQTSYGQAILVKVGLLCVALVARRAQLRPQQPSARRCARASRHRPCRRRTSLLRRLIAGEIAIVAAIILAAMVLSSLPPPAKALAEVGRASAKVGPGAVHQLVHHGPYQLAVAITPNRAAEPSTFQVTLTRGGEPVRARPSSRISRCSTWRWASRRTPSPNGPPGCTGARCPPSSWSATGVSDSRSSRAARRPSPSSSSTTRRDEWPRPSDPRPH